MDWEIDVISGIDNLIDPYFESGDFVEWHHCAAWAAGSLRTFCTIHSYTYDTVGTVTTWTVTSEVISTTNPIPTFTTQPSVALAALTDFKHEVKITWTSTDPNGLIGT